MIPIEFPIEFPCSLMFNHHFFPFLTPHPSPLPGRRPRLRHRQLPAGGRGGHQACRDAPKGGIEAEKVGGLMRFFRKW